MVWPCRHCNFTRARDELLETVRSGVVAMQVKERAAAALHSLAEQGKENAELKAQLNARLITHEQAALSAAVRRRRDNQEREAELKKLASGSRTTRSSRSTRAACPSSSSTRTRRAPSSGLARAQAWQASRQRCTARAWC